jgi:hypothetical protein
MEIIAVLSLLVSVAFLIVFCIAVFGQRTGAPPPASFLEIKITTVTRTYDTHGNELHRVIEL